MHRLQLHLLREPQNHLAPLDPPDMSAVDVAYAAKLSSEARHVCLMRVLAPEPKVPTVKVDAACTTPRSEGPI
jgi:hypothetical protein